MLWGVGEMINAIVRNLQNFYDTTVFFAILIIGLFLVFWDYPIFKSFKFKRDAAVTMVMGIIFLIVPFILYAISRL